MGINYLNNYTDIYSVYVKLSADNHVELIDSSYQISPTDGDGWVKIDEGTGIKYALAGTNYIDEIPLQTIGGAWKYKLVDGRIEKCSQQDIEEQERAGAENLRIEEESLAKTRITVDDIIDGYAEHEYRLCMLELFGEEVK